MLKACKRYQISVLIAAGLNIVFKKNIFIEKKKNDTAHSDREERKVHRDLLLLAN